MGNPAVPQLDVPVAPTRNNGREDGTLHFLSFLLPKPGTEVALVWGAAKGNTGLDREWVLALCVCPPDRRQVSRGYEDIKVFSVLCVHMRPVGQSKQVHFCFVFNP